MKSLQIFNYNGNSVRTIEMNRNLWWVLKDVCDILGLSNPSKVALHLDEDECSNFELGRQDKVNIIKKEQRKFSVPFYIS